MTAPTPEPTPGAGSTPAPDGSAGFAPLDSPAAAPWPAPPGAGWQSPGTDGVGPWPPRPEAPRIPVGRRLGAAALTAAVVAVVGAPLGLLWSAVAPGVPIIKTDDGAVFATPSPEQFIASDGWFTILLFALGVLAALVSWIGFRRYRGPLTLVALVVGTTGASILAWQVGRRIGLGDYREQVLAAQSGDLVTRPPDLRAGGFTKLWDTIPFVRGDLLIATFGAVIIYTLLAGWSRTPSLRPEPRLPATGAAPNPYHVFGQPADLPTLPARPDPLSGGPADPPAPPAMPDPPSGEHAGPPAQPTVSDPPPSGQRGDER